MARGSKPVLLDHVAHFFSLVSCVLVLVVLLAGLNSNLTSVYYLEVNLLTVECQAAN
jgi:hypothetical protein